MSRGATIFNGVFKALIFVVVFLLATAMPSRSAPSPTVSDLEERLVLMSLQDQCLARAERSQNPDRMRAVCIGWALLALDSGGLARSKADALRDTCLREVRFGGEDQIRESRAQGEAMCRNFRASVAD
jgi:hypothetical protein